MGPDDVSNDWADLLDQLLAFRAERDWAQFHTPKNLAASISIEAAELLEVFQWSNELDHLSNHKRVQAEKEIADVLIYLILISHELGIDALAAAKCKIVENAAKYPVGKAKGNATKYSEM